VDSIRRWLAISCPRISAHKKELVMARQGLSKSNDRLSVATGAAITGEYRGNKSGVQRYQARIKGYQKNGSELCKVLTEKGLQYSKPPEVVLSLIRPKAGKCSHED
jgi:hypothetical protein